jgi:hypothetical protein
VVLWVQQQQQLPISSNSHHSGKSNQRPGSAQVLCSREYSMTQRPVHNKLQVLLLLPLQALQAQCLMLLMIVLPVPSKQCIAVPSSSWLRTVGVQQQMACGMKAHVTNSKCRLEPQLAHHSSAHRVAVCTRTQTAATTLIGIQLRVLGSQA